GRRVGPQRLLPTAGAVDVDAGERRARLAILNKRGWRDRLREIEARAAPRVAHDVHLGLELVRGIGAQLAREASLRGVGEGPVGAAGEARLSHQLLGAARIVRVERRRAIGFATVGARRKYARRDDAGTAVGARVHRLLVECVGERTADTHVDQGPGRHELWSELEVRRAI